MNTRTLPALPADCQISQHEGEPVFEAPWQARSFAMAVQLNEAGLFTWSEWADELTVQLACQSGTIQTATHYYTAWQTTLEALVETRLKQS